MGETMPGSACTVIESKGRYMCQNVCQRHTSYFFIHFLHAINSQSVIQSRRGVATIYGRYVLFIASGVYRPLVRFAWCCVNMQFSFIWLSLLLIQMKQWMILWGTTSRLAELKERSPTHISTQKHSRLKKRNACESVTLFSSLMFSVW